MTIRPKETAKLRHLNNGNDGLCRTETINNANTEEIIYFGFAAEKLACQSTGDLVYSVEHSINGEHWELDVGNDQNIPANQIHDLTRSHLISSVKITWTSGSGTVTIVAR